MKNVRHWPPGLPLHVELPQTSVYYNLEVSARRYPQRAAIVYYGNTITYRELEAQVNSLAGFLHRDCAVTKGDRVVLFLQNSPQFIIAYYAILRLGAIVVPVNTMNLAEELRHIVTDSGSRVAVFGQELLANIAPLLANELQHAIVACYSDYVRADTDLPIPEVVRGDRLHIDGCVEWNQAVSAGAAPPDVPIVPEDLAVIPYTSGTTGAPKGCMHSHRSVMHTAVATMQFCRAPKDQIVLAALPMFHVTGMQLSVNSIIYDGRNVQVGAALCGAVDRAVPGHHLDGHCLHVDRLSGPAAARGV